MKFFIKDFFSKCGQIRRKLPIWSHILKKFLIFNILHIAKNVKLLSFLNRNSGSTWNFSLKLGPCPAGVWLLKVKNRNTRARCEICSKSTIKTSDRRHWRSSGVFIVNFEQISVHTLC